jgi:integrase
MQELTVQSLPGQLLAYIASVQDNYSRQVPAWIKWMRETGHGVDEEGIKAYFDYLLNDSGYAAGSIRVKRQAVKARVLQAFQNTDDATYAKLERFLHRLDKDPATKAPKVQPAPVDRSKVLRAVDWEALQAACHSDRQRCFIRFLHATGCRVAELCSARLDWCEVSESSVRIRIIGKGKKERFIRIQRALYDFIRETFQGTTYLFETSNARSYHTVYVSKQVQTIAARIGRHMTAHGLRHTFATRMVQAYPGKLDAISSYLGHSSPAITLSMYVHTSLSDEELFDAAAS